MRVKGNIIIFTLVAMLGALLFVFGYLQNDKYLVSTYPLNQPRSFLEVWSDKTSATAASIFYRIRTEKFTTPMTLFISTKELNPDTNLRILQSEDSTMVAASLENTPEEVVIIHDLAENIGWPIGKPELNGEENYAVGQMLFKRFMESEQFNQLHLLAY